MKNEYLPVVEGATSVAADMTCVVNGIVLDADVLANEGTWAVAIVVTDACESAPVETEKSNRTIMENNNNNINMYNSLYPGYISKRK